MTQTDIARITAEVASKVSPHRLVEARRPVRVAARELTIEFQPEPYPEVPAAFEEFSRVTGTVASLVRYRVDRDDEVSGARVTATISEAGRTATVTGFGPDVVSASVRAFAAGTVD